MIITKRGLIMKAKQRVKGRLRIIKSVEAKTKLKDLAKDHEHLKHSKSYYEQLHKTYETQ